jgi:phosphogluconate dehydratase
VVLLDATRGVLEAQVEATAWAARTPVLPDVSRNASGMGRELFSLFRAHTSDAESGARSVLP